MKKPAKVIKSGHFRAKSAQMWSISVRGTDVYRGNLGCYFSRRKARNYATFQQKWIPGRERAGLSGKKW